MELIAIEVSLPIRNWRQASFNLLGRIDEEDVIHEDLFLVVIQMAHSVG